MTHKQKMLVNLVAVAILAVVMVGWVFFTLVGGGIGNKPFTVTADFAASGGVFTNQEVTYRGVLVGKVAAMGLNDDGVDIILEIDPEWEGRIPADVAATVRSKSAVGEQFVNLTPRSDGAEMLAHGDVIPRSDTSLPVDFQELLKSLDGVLADIPPEETSRLIENLAGGLGGREQEIATILESLATLSDAFASVAEEQKSLLDNSTTAGEEFLRTKDAFAAAIRAADDVFAGLGDEPEETRRFLAENDRLAREGLELLARHGQSLKDGIRSLADFTSFQLDEKDSVIQSLEYTPQFLQAIEEASVPWRSPDGRRFYRIRVGLVEADDRREFWPCKYDLPMNYERLPHVRDPRKKNFTDVSCRESATTSDLTQSLITAMRAYASEPLQTADEVLLDFGEPGTGLFGISFGWPIDGAVTSYFGPRWGRMHQGIDIDGDAGDPVRASAPGTVVTSGYNAGGYGNVVVVDHGNGVSTLYAHLSSMTFAQGEQIEAGEVLGTVGCTGHCFGDHLHFELRVNGTPIDPLPYLPGGSMFAGLPMADGVHEGDIGG